jgi:hypothetical protein
VYGFQIKNIKTKNIKTLPGRPFGFCGMPSF